MTSLRSLIEAKERRTAWLPIPIGDVAAATAGVNVARLALQAHQEMLAAREDPDEQSDLEKATGERLVADLGAALEAQRQTVAYVELQALPADEWDAIFGPIEPDEDGEIALDDVRAALLAASCTDPELQDATWWEQQLARPEWSKGDKLLINRTLLDLNHAVFVGALGID